MRTLFSKWSYELSMTETLLVSMVYNKPTNAHMFTKVSEVFVHHEGTFILVEWRFDEDIYKPAYGFRFALISPLDVVFFAVDEIPAAINIQRLINVE